MRNYNFKHLSLLDEVSLSYPEIEQNILKPAIILTPISAPPLSGPLQATVNGSSGDDTLFGTSDDDALRGFEGDDILVGQAGADQLNGGVGYDFASYETSSIGLTLYLRQNTDLNTGDAEGDTFFGIEGIIGSDFDDFIDVGYNASVVGGGGDDIIIAGGGEFTPVYLVYASSDPNDYEFIHLGGSQYTIEAIGGTGEGFDTIDASEFTRVVFGGPSGEPSFNRADFLLDLATNEIEGTLNGETLNGSGTRDLIFGNGGADSFFGFAGEDEFYSDFDAVEYFGGTGDDRIIIETSVDTALGRTPTLDLRNVIFDSVESFSARIFNNSPPFFDHITLQMNAIQFQDFDSFVFVGGSPQIFEVYLDGQDLDLSGRHILGITDIIGSDADETVIADRASFAFYGEGGNDTFLVGSGSYLFDGGSGTDTISYADANGAITFDGLGLITASGDISDDTLISIEAIIATDFNDRLFGDNGVSILFGGEGADRLFGRNGDDELYGEGGNDIILAGRDNDLLDGGDGNDQLRGNEGDDMLFGGDGNDALAGGAGADVLDGGAGIDRVEYTFGTNAGVTASLADSSINTGDAAGDTYIDIENLFGTSFDDTLFGDAGDNRIDGRVGDDALFGGEGNDFLIGGAGDDILEGEAGNDLLLGQSGADTFQFGASHGTDRIFDFTQGTDLIAYTEGVFDFSDLTFTQDGSNVLIESALGVIIASNSLVSDFAADDFIFATPPQESSDAGQQDMAMYFEIDALF